MHHVPPVRLQALDESEGKQRVHHGDRQVLVHRKHLVVEPEGDGKERAHLGTTVTAQEGCRGAS